MSELIYIYFGGFKNKIKWAARNLRGTDGALVGHWWGTGGALMGH